MPAHIEALKLREMNLLASLAITRESLVQFLRLTPGVEATRRAKLRLQIDDIQDKTHGTIHFNYGISDDYLSGEGYHLVAGFSGLGRAVQLDKS
jgi:hypothetical protein